MKILYATHQFLPDYYAGTEILTFSTAREMLKRGHAVSIFSGYPVRGSVERANAFDAYEYDGIQVDRFFHSYRETALLQNPMEMEYNNLFLADYFRKHLQKIKPDMVHFYHLQRLSVSAIDVCRELGIPTVYSATDYWLICPANQLLLPDYSLCMGPDEDTVNCFRHLLELSQGSKISSLFKFIPDFFLAHILRWAKQKYWNRIAYASLVHALSYRPSHIKQRMNRLKLVLVATRFMENILIRFGLDQKRIRRISFGIDHDYFPEHIVKADSNRLRIGFIGTLYHHKGAHILLDAVRRLPSNIPFEVKIYGALDYYPEYSDTLRSLAGVDQRIKFCGTFQNTDIGLIFKDLDVLVVPSLWFENTPLVIHSAQAAGVPVIASNLGGINEIIENNVNGLLFERGDVKGLSEIIRRLCSDHDLVKKLSATIKKPKSMPGYVDELETIYHDVIDKR